MDKRLRIILEFISRHEPLMKAVRGVEDFALAVNHARTGIGDGIKRIRLKLKDLAETIFFVREAFNTLINIAQRLFNLFVKGAADSAKLEIRLKHITGSTEDAKAVMEELQQIAAATGTDYDALAGEAGKLAQASKDASGAFDLAKFKQMTDMISRISALEPDKPISAITDALITAHTEGDWSQLENLIGVRLRKLMGMSEEMGKAFRKRVSEIPLDDETAKNLDKIDEALRKAGATAELMGDLAEKSGMERLTELWKEFTKDVGAPIFEALNTQLTKLADWLEANPEKVEEFAELIGTTVADAITNLATAIEEFDWDKFAESMERIAKAVEDIATFGKGAAEAVGAIDKWYETEQEGGEGGLNYILGKLNEALKHSPVLQTGGTAAWFGPGVAGGKVLVEIALKSDLLDGKIAQTAGEVVAEFGNTLGQEVERFQ